MFFDSEVFYIEFFYFGVCKVSYEFVYRYLNSQINCFGVILKYLIL